MKRLSSPLWQKRALNQDDFTSSSPERTCFILFSCPSTQVRTFKTMLNKSENLLPDLAGNMFSFLPLSIILAVGFFIDALKKFPSILSLRRVFITNGY